MLQIISFLHFVLKIMILIRSLDTSKAHGHDCISIRMLKICDSALWKICKPLSIIFRNFISQGTFPDMWKKSNICLIHKKGDKQVTNNYRPVSLPPIVKKYLKDLFLMFSINILRNTSYSQLINLVFEPMIPV